MSPSQLAAVETSAAAVDLDLDQELILIRRFEDAIASLVQEGELSEPAARLSGVEFERSWRIATNMRGHMR